MRHFGRQPIPRCLSEPIQPGHARIWYDNNPKKNRSSFHLLTITKPPNLEGVILETKLLLDSKISVAIIWQTSEATFDLRSFSCIDSTKSHHPPEVTPPNQDRLRAVWGDSKHSQNPQGKTGRLEGLQMVVRSLATTHGGLYLHQVGPSQFSWVTEIFPPL